MMANRDIRACWSCAKLRVYHTEVYRLLLGKSISIEAMRCGHYPIGVPVDRMHRRVNAWGSGICRMWTRRLDAVQP